MLGTNRADLANPSALSYSADPAGPVI